MAASQGSDEGQGFLGYRKNRNVDVNELFILRG